MESFNRQGKEVRTDHVDKATSGGIAVTGLFGGDGNGAGIDFVTLASNVLIGFAAVVFLLVAGFLCQRLLGLMMFNFIQPWIPLACITWFLTGLLCTLRTPTNVWALALQINIPLFLFGFAVPFAIFAPFFTIPAAVGGVTCGRRWFGPGL